MSEYTPLAEKLNIAKDEVESMKNKVIFMISVIKQKQLNDGNIKKIFDEWVQLAHRLKKGGQMIEEYERAIPNKWDLQSNQKYMKLCNLYDFLMAMVGYYDTFFKKVLSREHYLHLMNAVLNVISD